MILGTWIMLESQTRSLLWGLFPVVFFMFSSPCLVQLFRRMLRLQLMFRKVLSTTKLHPTLHRFRVSGRWLTLHFWVHLSFKPLELANFCTQFNKLSNNTKHRLTDLIGSHYRIMRSDSSSRGLCVWIRPLLIKLAPRTRQREIHQVN